VTRWPGRPSRPGGGGRRHQRPLTPPAPPVQTRPALTISVHTARSRTRGYAARGCRVSDRPLQAQLAGSCSPLGEQLPVGSAGGAGHRVLGERGEGLTVAGGLSTAPAGVAVAAVGHPPGGGVVLRTLLMYQAGGVPPGRSVGTAV
jgi:hypothetical protein